jgi:Ni,Fe-hydrogenase maturation factor
MLTVLCFGNPYVDEDNLAIEIAQELKIDHVEFKILQNPDDILNYKDHDKLYLMDVFRNLDDLIVVNDIDKLAENKIFSLHDFDLGFFLKLMKETGELKEVIIIGLPNDGNKFELKQKIKDLMESFK